MGDLLEAGHIIPNHDIKARLEGLHKLGPKIVVITNGHKDVNCYDGNFLYIGKPHDVKVVETTGAGDAYIAGFLYGYLKNCDLKTSGEIGATLASYAIEKYGTQVHRLTVEQFKKRYEKAFNRHAEFISASI